MKKHNKEDILMTIGFVLLLIWTFVSMIRVMLDPPSVNDLTVEERIRYEQMIFP